MRCACLIGVIAALGCAGCPGPTTVTVTPGSAQTAIGETVTFTAASTDTRDTGFQWTSSNPGVAEVTGPGTMRGVSAGTATVTATGSYSGRSGTAVLQVTEGGSGEFRAPLTVILPEGAAGPVPVTVGVPVPAGFSAVEHFRVVGPTGAVPTQVREAVRLGGGGNMRWLLVDFQAAPGAAYALEEGTPPAPPSAVTVTADGARHLVNTGAGQWEVLGNSAILGAVLDGSGIPRIDGASWEGAAVPATVEVVEDGPLRAFLRLIAPAAVGGLDLVARVEFFAGLPYARVRLTLVNHRPAVMGAEMPGADNGECGVEETQPVVNGLNSPNRIVLEDVTWALDLAGDFTGEEVLYQDSSGTDAWNYYVGHAPRMQSGVSRRGYVRTINGAETETGDAAAGTLARAGVRLDVPWFREWFPQALRARAGQLEYAPFPGEYGRTHVLRVGEQKTHEAFVGLDPGTAAPWPVYASPAASYLRASEALGYLGPRVAGTFEEYEDYLDAMLDDSLYVREECVHNLPDDGCPTSLWDAQRRWDLIGWTDYGDVPTDFEFPTSPYNLKYDMNLGFILQALRTGSPGWWTWAHSANLHFADVDILHTPVRGYAAARTWWQGAAFGHSYHDETGISNPHRNCCNPTVDMAYGVAGLAAWALLTGDDLAREAALEFADNLMWRMRNSGDSDCSVLAWGGGTGEGWSIADPPSRGVANAQRALVWAYRLTGDAEYLETAGDTAAWYECERARGMVALGACASWQEALLARSMAEYVLTARAAGVVVHPQAETALAHLLESLRDNLGWDGTERAWLRTCENYTDTGARYNEINAWMFLAADVFALGYAVTLDRTWLDQYAGPCFTTAARDPWYEGDVSQYHSAKEVANTVPNGLAYLHFAQGGTP